MGLKQEFVPTGQKKKFFFEFQVATIFYLSFFQAYRKNSSPGFIGNKIGSLKLPFLFYGGHSPSGY